jgi:N,N'-diacetylchitobiose transport system permease protein
VTSTEQGLQVTDVDDADRPLPRSPSARDRRRRLRSRAFPYLLIVPAIAVLVVMLGYPLVRLVVLSVQKFGLRQQFGAPPEWVGLDNYRTILTDSYFWDVLWRTIIFCLVNVALTMIIGLAVALLLNAVRKPMRLLVSSALILAWAMPPLSATVVFQFLFDTEYGVVNWVLTRLGFGDYTGHSWLSEPLSFFAVATMIVVWMGVPFIAFTIYAGLTQVPQEIIEAASIDGAGFVARLRNVVIPMLMPVLLILAALSVLWDIRVFTQIYVLQRAGGITRDTNLLGVWAYRTSIGENHFDIGAAIAVVMVFITILLTVVYLRRMTRDENL